MLLGEGARSRRIAPTSIFWSHTVQMESREKYQRRRNQRVTRAGGRRTRNSRRRRPRRATSAWSGVPAHRSSPVRAAVKDNIV